MAQLKDSLITGDLRVTGTIYGNATSATALKDRTNNTLTYSNYGAAGLAGSSISWMTCWNGYELRAISKAETFNLVRDNGGNSTWVNISGDTMTGALNFANNTYNKMGDDAQIGDANQAGRIAIKGINGATGIYFAPYSGSTAQSFTIDGAGTATLTGSLSTTNLTLTNTTDATSSTAAGMKTAGGLAVAKKIWLGSGLGASSNNNNSSHLIISSSDTGAGGNVALELWRGTNASWQISNESGNLHFRTNYTTAKQTTYSVDAINIAYNTGNTIIKGTVTAPTFIGALNGNAATATKLATAQSITLTGDTTGTASSQAGWSIATTTKALTQNGGRISTPNTAHEAADYGKMYYLIASSAMDASGLKPKFSTNGAAPATHDGHILDFHWDNNGQYNFQLALSNAENSLSIRSNANSSWQDWTPVLTAKNVVTGDNNGQIKVGGTNVSVKGLGSNAYSSTAYLPLAGGTMTGQIQKLHNGQSWVNGRNGALIRNTSTTFTNNEYNPLWSVKSIDGTWDCGTYTANNSLYFSYITDTNYNAGTNATTAQIEFRGSDNSIRANKVYGAVWNDYAEYRKTDNINPGYCVIEKGDDTLTLSTNRLQPGAEIVSDTFGFAIGETDECKTPIAVSGRVLAYPYEDREEFKKNIGCPVCSGPNGTVSIMSDEEYKEKGYLAIGTISAVPDYEEWGMGKIKVDGRVWIRIK